jgi:signal transduction histidine kinase/AmiR/NasT family two-component response regulator
MNEQVRHIDRKILILEDEPAHAEAIRRYLSTSEFDCSITIAGTLKDFNDIVQVTTPELVIADINLPDGSALSILKGDIESQPWPVLIMTSFGDEEIAVKAIKSGALDYIVKSPETFKNIEHVVKRNLREWRIYQKSRENERKFRLLFETMDQGVIYLDEKGKVSAVNTAAERITGYSLEEMQGMQFFNPGLWFDINSADVTTSMESHPALLALNSGTPVINRIMGIHNPAIDANVWLLVSSIPQFRKDGNLPYQVFTTITDITQLKNTELELKKAKEKAEESDRLKSVFMANMSHEIRTPMNGILGFAELLKTPELSGESQKMYIEAISTSGRRMLNIINDLIDISRIEAGQTEIKLENTNVRSLMRELILFFRPEAEKKSIDLSTSVLIPGDMVIYTDRTKLAQVLTNLLKNALKFTPDFGSIELGCRIYDEKNLMFHVRDTGTGIRPDLQDKIFERFRQGDDADLHEGVGLGLAISKAYVEMLGGKIGLESEAGKGSYFFFTLPRNEVNLKQNEMIEDEESSVSSATETCILVAEDDDLSYTLIRESLKRANIRTCHARNGREAIDLARNMQNISLILMDIKLPEVNGLAATREIKKFKPEIPIIAQSAYASQADIRQSIEAGCDDYITKPIDIKLLMNKISRYNLQAS